MDEIVEYIKRHQPTIEDIISRFPEVDHWTLRRIRRDIMREVSVSEVGVPLPPNLTPSAEAVLKAGMLRPTVVHLVDRPTVKPIFEKEGDTYLIMSDLHAPDVDEDALDVALQIGQSLPLSRIIINGDGMDVHALSSYVPAADKPYRFVDERKEAVKTFVYIRELFPEVPITYILGNHDKRPEVYLARVAPQFQDLFTVEQILGLDGLGFEFVDGRYVVPNTNLLVKHGTTARKNSGYTVHNEVASARMSVIIGHVHKLSMVSSRGIVHEVTGKQPYIGVESGCLCSLTPSYLPPENTADWQHGAVVVTVYSDGMYSAEPIMIHEGTAMFRGHRYRSRRKHGTEQQRRRGGTGV